MRRWSLLWVWVLVCGVASAQEEADSSGQAAGQGVLLSARVGLTDRLLMPDWVPLEVQLRSGRARDVVLEVEVRRSEGAAFRIERELTLAGGDQRREWVMVPAIGGREALAVRVRPKEGEEEGEGEGALAATTLDVVVEQETSRWRGRGIERAVLMISERSLDQVAWFWSQGDAAFGLRRPEEVPGFAMAYDALDLVVVQGAAIDGLGSEQVQALEHWVRSGGSVLLLPAQDDPDWWRSALVEGLAGVLQVAPTQRDTVEIVEAVYGLLPPSSVPTGTFPVWAIFDHGMGQPLQRPPSSTQRSISRPLSEPLRFWPLFDVWDPPFDAPPPSATLWEGAPEDGAGLEFPLIYEASRGEGMISIACFDALADPFRGMRERRLFASDMLRRASLGRKNGARELQLGGGRRLQEDTWVKALDSREDPSKLLILLAIWAYIICIGPVNVLVLRRKRALLRLAWTTPLLALGFSVVVFVAGYVSLGVSSVVWRAGVWEMPLGETVAWEREGVSVQAAVAGSYPIAFPPGQYPQRLYHEGTRWSVVRNQPALELREGEGVELVGVPLSLRGQAFFASRGLFEFEGPLRVDAAGRVQNATGYDLARAVVVREGSLSLTGRVASGGPPVGAEEVDLSELSDVGRRHRLARLHKGLIARLLAGEEYDRAWLANVLEASRARPLQADEVAVFGLFERAPTALHVDGEAEADREVFVIVAQGRVE